MRALLWAGVSSRSQIDEDKDSLQSQIAACRQFAEQMEWTIVGALAVPGITRSYRTFDEAIRSLDSELGGNWRAIYKAQLDQLGVLHHNAYRELRNLINKRAFDVLICRGRDRIGRTDALISNIEEECRSIGTYIYSLTMPGTGSETGDLFISAIERANAQREIIELVRRTRIGMDNRAMRGQVLTGRIPFGYSEEWELDGRRPKRLAVVNPEEAQAYLWAVQSTLKGIPQWQIAQALANQFPDRSWSRTTIREIYQSAFYLGLIVRRRTRTKEDTGLLRVIHTDVFPFNDPRWGETEKLLADRSETADWLHLDKHGHLKVHIVARGVHEPIIDCSTWIELQNLLIDRRKSRKPYSTRGLWSGIVCCGKCGRKMHISWQKSANGKKYYRYLCPRDRTVCRNHISEISLNKQALEFMRQLLVASSSQLATMEEDVPTAQSIDQPRLIEKELDNLNQQQDRLTLLFRTGRIDIDEFDRNRQAIKQQIDTAVAALRAAQIESQSSARTRQRISLIGEIIPHLETHLSNLDTADANRLLRGVFSAIYVIDTIVTHYDLG